METVLKTNDLVLLSLAQAVLRDAAIQCVVFDEYTSAIEGSIGAIPRRLCVAATQADRARSLIEAIEAGSWEPIDEWPDDGDTDDGDTDDA